MRLERLCDIDISYVGGFHLARPYGNEAGLGWGVGEGVASGERLGGAVRWSNHELSRGDGTMLPNVRGLITTADDAEVIFELTGRTVWVNREGGQVGRQVFMALFESQDDRYAWLNNTVAIAEGKIANAVAHLEVYLCDSDLV